MPNDYQPTVSDLGLPADWSPDHVSFPEPTGPTLSDIWARVDGGPEVNR